MKLDDVVSYAETAAHCEILRFRNSFGIASVCVPVYPEARWVGWMIRFYGDGPEDYCPCRVPGMASAIWNVTASERDVYAEKIAILHDVRDELPDEADLPF